MNISKETFTNQRTISDMRPKADTAYEQANTDGEGKLFVLGENKSN